jgi:hypothetical protein
MGYTGALAPRRKPNPERLFSASRRSLGPDFVSERHIRGAWLTTLRHSGHELAASEIPRARHG